MFINKRKEISLDDLKELERVMRELKSDKLKDLIKNDVDTIRSKFVTKIINESKEDMEDDLPEKPIKEPFDEIKYWKQKIKGFNAKARSLKEITGKRTKIIYEALICLKGREEEAMTALLSESELPPRPPIPLNALKEHDRQFEKMMEDYHRKLESIQNKKKKKYIEDLNPHTISEESINKRIRKVENEISRVEDLTSMYGSGPLSHVPMKDEDEEEEGGGGGGGNGVMSTNNLYLPGERECLLRDEDRVFTFHQERAFSNEVNHVHFRVAESQFYRMSNNSNLKVTEVKYLVTPHLIRKYEIKKRELSGTKQYLMFSQHEAKEKAINYIRLNNFPANSFAKGRIFSARPAFCSRFLPQNSNTSKEKNSILLCLVITGREKRGTLSNSRNTKPRGFDSIVETNADHFCVFHPDQVLPYYIVTYEHKNVNVQFNNASQNTHSKHLDEEWANMEKEAHADKEQDEIKRAYLESLKKKEKERKMGNIDPTKSGGWFSTFLQKKNEKEKEKGGGIPKTPNLEEFDFDFESPTTPMGMDDDFFEGETPTPLDDDVSPQFEEEEEEGEFEFEMEDEET